jgi:uncharacterized delta-60 repeat protein
LEDRIALTAGSLDPTFGMDGKVLTDFTRPAELVGNDMGSAVAIQQADGKIVVVGNSNSFETTNELVLARYNTDGSLDTTFGDEGRVRNTFPTFSAATGLALQADGRIVVAGYTSGRPGGNGGDFFVARYNTNGTLDTTFDSDGWLTTDLGADDLGQSVAVQAGGKIVVAGYSMNDFTGADFAVASYNADGSLDTGFDGDGFVTTDFGFSDTDTAFSVALQADGKIILAGNTYQAGPSVFALARYNTDGSLDESFDADGLVTTDLGSFDDGANSVAVQADGKIVAAGHSNQFLSGSNGYDFALARYNADGTLDADFGTAGKITTDFGNFDDFAHSVAVQADGKIVAAGSTSNVFALARYNADGTVDEGFGTLGQVTTDFGGIHDAANSVVLQSDGKIVAAGFSYQGFDSTEYDFALARYNSDGSLHEGFGSGGMVTTEFPVTFVSYMDTAHAVSIQQPDGKIIVAGTSEENPFGGIPAIALARYNTDGTLDTTFGTGGQVRDSLPVLPDIDAMALQSDGKIVVAGFAFGVNFDYDFFVARYNSDGTLDTSFDEDGWLTTDFGGTDDLAAGVAVQADGKIVVAGQSALAFTPNFDFALARYNSDGSLDTDFDGDGLVTTDFGGTDADIVFDMALAPEGKIVVVGATIPAGSGQLDFALARYETSGALDLTFDEDGRVVTELGGLVEILSSVAVQSDGRIVAAGISDAADPNVNGDFALLRYTVSGALDASFDGDGLVLTDFGNPVDWAFGVTLQPDGKIVAAGATGDNVTNDFALARYHANGALDASFDGDGRVTTDFGSGDDASQGVILQADGKIVVAGVSDQGGTRSKDFALARYEGLFTGAVLEPDTTDPSKTQLVVGGTRGDDKIKIQKVGNTGAVEVKLNGTSLGTFNPTGRIIVYGHKGDDDIQVSNGVTQSAWLYGGEDDDRLSAGAGDDVLLGGDGDDLLHAGAGRDLLIGGTGGDRLLAQGEDDILIAGYTDHDTSEEALSALSRIMDEWTRTDRGFALRVVHLRGVLHEVFTGGNNDGYFLNDQTVHDDAEEDMLTGGSETDWFLFNKDGDGDRQKKDKVTDMSLLETLFAQDIDFINEP